MKEGHFPAEDKQHKNGWLNGVSETSVGQSLLLLLLLSLLPPLFIDIESLFFCAIMIIDKTILNINKHLIDKLTNAV